MPHRGVACEGTSAMTIAMTNPILVIAAAAIALTVCVADHSTADTANCVVSCREEIPSCHSHARSGPDRMHDRRLPTNSAGLPPGNRLQLGRYPDRFRCCRLPASTGAARLKSRVNLR